MNVTCGVKHNMSFTTGISIFKSMIQIKCLLILGFIKRIHFYFANSSETVVVAEVAETSTTRVCVSVSL